MAKVFGYCRISTKQQNIERQIRNIKEYCQDALIVEEVYTGTKFQGRNQLERIIRDAKEGDTIIFDSVSRMSRNAEEGVKVYFELLERGINLVFLKEHYIDTEVYLMNTKDKIELTGTDEDEIFKGLNNYFRKLAERQIKIAFEQSEKEVEDLRQRTREGIETARINGKQIGQAKGKTLKVKKSIQAKEIIQKQNKAFEGELNDTDTITLLKGHFGKFDHKTFYKYKKEMLAE